MSFSLFPVASLAGLLALLISSATPASGQKKNPFQNPFANPVDQAGLPRVLIVGDSISIGYTPRVRRLLDGKANVHRAKTNCRWSAYGAEHIDTWVGDSHWDVVHFNFGLWDWYGWSQEVKATPQSYAKSLEEIVTKLKKKTKAKLIFATTTPPCIGPEKKVKITISEKRAAEFNQAARAVMEKHGVAINDLYKAIGYRRAEFQLGENDVHYNDKGRDLLAARVAEEIGSRLHQRPTMREFMGINGHTVQFKAELYKAVASKVRDYHPLTWDIGNQTDKQPDYPWAVNRVNWENVYRPWVKSGYEIDACLMIQDIQPDSWKDIAADGYRIGKAFASFFGPSGKHQLVASMEIGNEPGKYSDARYREVFEAMAKGARAGDAQMKIVTCATTAGESHDYAKSLECVKGLESLYDVISLHTYAQLEGWPTWRRSFPEDPRTDYLKDVRRTIEWRNKNAPGKEIWITEFGWDSTTKANAKEGTFKDWVGNSDEEQAVYLVRSFLVFASMDVDRAYIYFFNDSDEAKLHAASGLTRNFNKKPSFFAVQWLREQLGDYRFVRAIDKEPGKPWRLLFEHAEKPGKKVLAIWDPIAVGKGEAQAVPIGHKGKITRTERMPLKDGAAGKVAVADGKIDLGKSGHPVLIWFE